MNIGYSGCRYVAELGAYVKMGKKYTSILAAQNSESCHKLDELPFYDNYWIHEPSLLLSEYLTTGIPENWWVQRVNFYNGEKYAVQNTQ
jgi:hypothetical protein